MLIFFLPFSVFPFPGLVTRLFGSSIQDKDRQDYLGLLEVPDSYCGPRLQFPLTFTDIDLLIEAFKQQQASGSTHTVLILVQNMCSIAIYWMDENTTAEMHSLGEKTSP